MNIMSFIPARGGSKGVPGKNKKILGDKPLIAWTIEDALESRLFDRVVVSTEDEQIAAISREWGAEVIMRPEELATDTANLDDAIRFTLEQLEIQDYIPDYMVIMSPTSPFRRHGLVDQAIRMALEDTNVCYVHSLRPIAFDPGDLAYGDGKPFMARDMALDLKDRTFSVSMSFGVQRMEEGESRRRGIVLDSDESIDIDLPVDWQDAEKAVTRWI
jgi:CMP-N-acetylneuraminic acid synthetase